MDQAKRLKELEQENARLKRLVAELSLDRLVLKDIASGNFEALNDGAVRSATRVSVAPASGMHAFCWGNSEARSATGRHGVKMKMLWLAIVTLASQYGRYGFRRITALLQRDGWQGGTCRSPIWRARSRKSPKRPPVDGKNEQPPQQPPAKNGHVRNLRGGIPSSVGRIMFTEESGGGRRLQRTTLWVQFPANREIYREFCEFSLMIPREDQSIILNIGHF